jgi:hypothetical protein
MKGSRMHFMAYTSSKEFDMILPFVAVVLIITVLPFIIGACISKKPKEDEV